MSEADVRRFVLLEQIQTHVKAIAEGHMALNDKFDRLEAGHVALDEKFDRLETKFDARLARIEGHVGLNGSARSTAKRARKPRR
ncbi:MAG: hypothetical protein AB7O24_29435 [Kofleriaceae bacterium]